MIKSNTGYVYLNLLKNPANEGRIKNLQTGNHNELVIVYEIKSKCYTSLEKTLHRTFTYNHLRGEWFNFPDTNPDTIIQEIIRTNNNLELLLENMTYL